MSKQTRHAGNPLGDLRAEADHSMLDKAFYETPDYRNLIETSDKAVVVGRRGSGKSALTYQLGKYWADVPKTKVVPILLEEDQVIGLNPIVELFGDQYRLIRAGCSIAWRYCLLMEMALQIAVYFKFEKAEGADVLISHLKTWRTAGNSPSSRIRQTLKKTVSASARAEERIGDLADGLGISQVENALLTVLDELNFTCVLLIDKLDEGYEPTPIGVGFVDGIVDATISINNKFKASVRATLFLRDNMFRTIAKMNPDFSRDIEGQVLRLHWSEYELLNMVCIRLRIAFDIKQERSRRVWDQCVAKELKGIEGFKTCLLLTLYRPRDILVLLNEAFYEASKKDRAQIILEDVRISAKNISQYRLDDLHKEYSAIIPGLRYLTTAFSHRNPEFDLAEANAFLKPVLSSSTYTIDVEQHFTILCEPFEVLRELYRIGYVGIRDDETGAYVFCHDGKSPDREIAQKDQFLVHPCYWMALNLTRNALTVADAQEIHDEYDITVKGGSNELRAKKLQTLISKLDQIGLGDNYQQEFERWCAKTLSTVLAGALRNIKLSRACSPGGRKRVVGLNLSRTDVWQRVFEDYGARQVVFQIENSEKLNRQHCQDASRGLSEDNGSIVFIVTRDESLEVRKDSDLAWIREIWQNKGTIIIKLSAKILARLLGKLRNPQKHDAVDKQFNGILDSYSRVYLRNVSKKSKKKAKSSTLAEKREAASVPIPSSECYGEIYIDNSSQLFLKLFIYKDGPGKRSEACAPVKIYDQAYRILESGIKNARLAYIHEKQETARGDGIPIDASECEPPNEYTYQVAWSRDELACILHEKNEYAQLQKKQKQTIKTAMSRLRNLVTFTDGKSLVSEPDDMQTRYATVRFRLSQSG